MSGSWAVRIPFGRLGGLPGDGRECIRDVTADMLVWSLGGVGGVVAEEARIKDDGGSDRLARERWRTGIFRGSCI